MTAFCRKYSNGILPLLRSTFLPNMAAEMKREKVSFFKTHLNMFFQERSKTAML